MDRVTAQLRARVEPSSLYYFGDMAEWLIATDCKSVLNCAVVRIHLSPPYNCFVSIAGLMRYPVTVEIRGSNPLRGAKQNRLHNLVAMES